MTKGFLSGWGGNFGDSMAAVSSGSFSGVFAFGFAKNDVKIGQRQYTTTAAAIARGTALSKGISMSTAQS
ncbi:MAG: hypothetical protein JW959_12010 [Pirellulales bacterium]|nr:hypothetical protein [Pirellulales bacterium]